MIWQQETLLVPSSGRGTIELTERCRTWLRGIPIETGMLQLFLQHTSASLILCENADPVVHDDLERFMEKNVIDGDPIYQHSAEGPDDMTAHIRSILTTNSLNIPIGDGQLLLGTWQGIYLWEHRVHPHQRCLIMTAFGE